jgi:transposase
MDTYASQGPTDSLGRRGDPRRRRPLEEKRRIVEETLVAGASVAVVARRHELNANILFGWRRLYQAGRLTAA